MTRNINRPDADVESMSLPPELAELEQALTGLAPSRTNLDANALLLEVTARSYPAPIVRRRIWMHGAVAGVPIGIALGAAAAAILMGIFMKQNANDPSDLDPHSPESAIQLADGDGVVPTEEPQNGDDDPTVHEEDSDIQLVEMPPSELDPSESPEDFIAENVPAPESNVSLLAHLFGMGRRLQDPQPVRPALDPEDLDGYLAEMQILAERMESAADRMGSDTRIYQSSPSYDYRPAVDGPRLRPFDATSLLENEYFYQNPLQRNPEVPPEAVPDSDSSEDVLPPSFGSLDSDVSRTL